MLVDDERWALIAIKKFIEMNDSCFKIVCQQTDSIKALSDIFTYQPDLVFTDIVMPMLSGLDLMRLAREKGASCRFVVVSGYDEFSYVRKALQEGAIDYLLKPLDIRNSSDILLRITSKLASLKESDDQMLYASLQGLGADINLPEYMRDGSYSLYQSIVLFGDKPLQLSLDIRRQCRVLSLQIGPRRHLSLLYSDQDMSELILQTQSDILTAKEPPYIGISKCDGEIEAIPRLIRHSMHSATSCSFINPQKRICRYKRPNPEAVYLFCDRLLHDFSAKDHVAFNNSMQRAQEYFIKNDLRIDDAVVLHNYLVMAVAKMTPYNDANKADISQIIDSDDILDLFSDFSELIGELTVRLFKEGPNAEYGSCSFDKMIRYINDNYTKELRLSDLSGMFFINYSYCCQLFSKELGTTFTKYLTQLRIQKACKLLLASSCSILKVSEKVGFNDYFYFTKVFKKVIGVTPSQYRKMKGV
ncbi:MAG: response regulator transcription factor [Christensenellales bacterium]